jgi:hypothetical protein
MPRFQGIYGILSDRAARDGPAHGAAHIDVIDPSTHPAWRKGEKRSAPHFKVVLSLRERNLLHPPRG